jgi:hypothetical protein
MRCRDPWFNPKGIASFSPRLARFREGLPWVIAGKPHNPERVVYQNSRRTGSTLSGLRADWMLTLGSSFLATQG